MKRFSPILLAPILFISNAVSSKSEGLVLNNPYLHYCAQVIVGTPKNIDKCESRTTVFDSDSSEIYDCTGQSSVNRSGNAPYNIETTNINAVCKSIIKPYNDSGKFQLNYTENSGFSPQKYAGEHIIWAVDGKQKRGKFCTMYGPMTKEYMCADIEFKK